MSLTGMATEVIISSFDIRRAEDTIIGFRRELETATRHELLALTRALALISVAAAQGRPPSQRVAVAAKEKWDELISTY